jgi:hypothetical protein
MNLHKRAIATIGGFADLMFGKRPEEQPLGFLRSHVNTAMAHRHTKVVMPIRAMEGVPLRCEK